MSAKAVSVTTFNGVTMKIDRCWRENRTEVHCDGLGVSEKQDRAFGIYPFKAIDNKGNEFDAAPIVGGVQRPGYDATQFLADTPMKLEFVIGNVPTDATSISALWQGDARFSGIPIQQESPAVPTAPQQPASAEPTPAQ